MLPKTIQNLINHFAKFPSIGPRQAARFVFQLLKRPEREIREFAKAIIDLKEISHCSLCHRIIEKPENNYQPLLCSLCRDDKREKDVICLVEKDTDIEAIEKTGRYNGLYYVLGGNEIKSFNKENIRELGLKNLLDRIKNNKSGEKIKEIIIATSATTNGDILALYISRLFKAHPSAIKITRLGRGLSTGSELEYMDEETLSQALIARK